MDIINDCFEGIVLVKVDNKEGYSIYAASINSSYGDGKKTYLLAFVPSHLASLERGYLREINWSSIQTRLLESGYKLPSGKNMPRQSLKIPKDIANFFFILRGREETKSKYIADGYPLEMVLLHDPKKKSKYQYHDKTNLIAAISSFRCVISLTNERHAPVTSVVSDINRDQFVDLREKTPEKYDINRTTARSKLRYQSVDVNHNKDDLSLASLKANDISSSRPAAALGENKIYTKINRPAPWDSTRRPVLDRTNDEMRYLVNERGNSDINDREHFPSDLQITTPLGDVSEFKTSYPMIFDWSSYHPEYFSTSDGMQHPDHIDQSTPSVLDDQVNGSFELL